MPAGLFMLHSARTSFGSGLAVAAEGPAVAAEGSVTAADGVVGAAECVAAAPLPPQAASPIKVVQTSPIDSRSLRIRGIWVTSWGGGGGLTWMTERTA